MSYRAAQALSILAVLAAGHGSSLEGQSLAARPSVSLFGGVASGPGGSGAVLVGAERRTPELGRLSAAAAGSTWWLVGVGCDLILGAPCDKRAKTLDIGPVVRLRPRGRSRRVEARVRMGGFWYGGRNHGIWDPSAGLGFGFGESRKVGGLLGIHYHALMSDQPASLPYRPDQDDRLVATAGLRLRF